MTRVLAAMERTGVRLDVHRLGEIGARVRDRADELRDRIWELAGGEFVIDSPKQLGEVLFERLGLPTFRKGKTGWSTDRKVLQLLAGKHPIIELIGQYRELTKLDNTYLSALPELVDEHERLHTTFNQTVAETGRLSSTNPNLQNIPVRTPLGREIRGASRPTRAGLIVSCDYSQVELRILAHCSGEPALDDVFRRGEDVHRATAPRSSAWRRADVDRTTRDRAKVVNFGIVYGISDFGLSEQLNIPRDDATQLHRRLPGALPAGAQLHRHHRSPPPPRTATSPRCSGAAARSPSSPARTVQQRQLGERLAVNTVIQGTAADIIKVAMIGAHAALADEGLQARLILQIHDELLLEAPAEEAARAGAVVREDGRRLPARPAARGGRRRRRDLAGGQEVAEDDPYRILQVDPEACPQVIDAAFTVLREMVLRSDDDDAPRRLARLGAAYRTLGDPGRRAAHDLLRGRVAAPARRRDSSTSCSRSRWRTRPPRR